ncbi:energy-coupling factor ABC transporter ATP-binding protein [Blastochloris viridis]|uniref:ATPase component BioM of energizing module of biotin ECF transporter n=1 Tax=Blastochloris viridis TaxID=1079 RepID=A0A0H5BDJ0_BLAVI|nr:ABC transporter ATP-binding protein [Blastochloris viridis]ALK08346.1 Biotin transport ATP-binding protein BioM [Blastochloris viridis]BAR98381.1 ATPase component BioM of energizing module of biotin ECF transporter [Blastochloris viridis]CUU44268.1 Biotin transport ATP-binding protein BioM [Blastochloris viridis]
MRSPDPSPPEAATPKVAFEGACVTIEDRAILLSTTLTLAERRVAIIGANGSGKSTFARLVNGLIAPTAGRVTVDGLDTVADAAKVRRTVGFVFQNPDNQIVFPMVSEDVAFGLKNVGLAKAEIPARIAAELGRFGIAHLAERASHSLSGGEKQMVALCSVLVMRPRLIVFDEPTTLLDLNNRNRLRAAIAALPQSAIVVTHDLDLIGEFDRVLVIEDGRVAADDAPAAAVPWYVGRAS